jgi:hypothetical protein
MWWVGAFGCCIRATVDHAQADALEIEAGAKRRIAEEYDAAQERGEVAKRGDPRPSATEGLATVEQIGLTYMEIHEARIIRDAELIEPPGAARCRSRARWRHSRVWAVE